VIDRLPIFPLETVLMPGMTLPLHIFEPRYRRLMHDTADLDPAFGIVLVREGGEVGGGATYHEVGVAASYRARMEMPDGRWATVVEGGRRFRVLHADDSRGYLTASVQWLDERDGDGDLAALHAETRTAFGRLAVAFARSIVGDGDVASVVGETAALVSDDPREASYLLATRFEVQSAEKQGLLECPDTASRLRALNRILDRERRLLQRGGIGPSAVANAPVAITLN
jgi:Lon protease-like protein